MTVTQRDPAITADDVRAQQSQRIEQLEHRLARQEREIETLYAAMSQVNDRLRAIEKPEQ